MSNQEIPKIEVYKY